MRVTRKELNERVRLIRDGKPPPFPHNRSEEVFWREDLRGFGVRQTYTGQASWVVQYKMHGRTKKETIGDVTKLDEAAAIKSAKIIWAKMYLDRLDPQEAKARARATAKVTFEVVAEEFLAAKELEGLRENTLRAYRRALRQYYRPLHKMPLDEITPKQINDELKRIHSGPGPGAARQCYDILALMFKWAYENDIHSGPSPTLKVPKPPKSEPRERVFNDDEIRAIWLGCDAWEVAATKINNRDPGGLTPDSAHATRLLLLTACRGQEIGELEWSEIDFDKNELVIPGRRTKNKQTHYLPLTKTALDILKRVYRRPGEKHVFGTVPGKGKEMSKANKDVDVWIEKAAGKERVPPPWTMHDIRRTVRTRMAEIGIPDNIAERVLNHREHIKRNQQTYDHHHYRPEMRDAMARWEAHLLLILREEFVKKPTAGEEA